MMALYEGPLKFQLLQHPCGYVNKIQAFGNQLALTTDHSIFTVLTLESCYFLLNNLRATGTIWIAVAKQCDHLMLHVMTTSLSDGNPSPNCHSNSTLSA